MVITSAHVVAHVAVPLFAADDRKDQDTFAMKVSMRSRGLVRSHDYHEQPYNSWASEWLSGQKPCQTAIK